MVEPVELHYYGGCESFAWVTLRGSTVRLGPKAVPEIATADV
jgi:hypothetical protein